MTWSKSALLECEKRKKKVKKEGSFYIFETNHYNIKTAVDEKFTAELSVYMDYLYEKLRFAVKGRKRVTVKPEVVIYGNEIDFCRKLQTQPGGARGVFYYKRVNYGKKWTVFTIYSFTENDYEKTFNNFYIPILNHEGTHQILQSYAGTTQINLFINEGLSTYIQFWRFDDEGFEKRAIRSEFREDVIEAAKQNKIEPLLDLLSIKKNWVPNDLHETIILRYGVAESFVAFLIENPIGKKYAKSFFDSAITGKDMAKSIGKKKIALIEHHWLEFIKKEY